MKKTVFWMLSITWGLPMTMIGAVAAAVLMAFGHKPKKWGYCYYFEIGNDWGGVELGAFFIVDHQSNIYIRNHEHGHAIQNCYYGFLMPFIVCIPSAVRYWYRRIRSIMGLGNKANYYDIWFEAQASRWGFELIEKLGAGGGKQ